MIIEIPGKPIPLARPRFFAQGSKFGARDGQKVEKSVVRGLMVKSLGEALNCEIKASVIDASKVASAIAFSVSMQFTFLFPKSWSKKKIKNSICMDFLPVHAVKPDIDNLVKFYLDCATGIIWDDDAKVCGLSANKCYGNEEKTMIVIHPHWSKENLA